MGLLPVRGDTPRTANIICIPEHDIWTLKTAAEVKDFLHKSFPQLSLEDVVSDEVPTYLSSMLPTATAIAVLSTIQYVASFSSSALVHRYPLQSVICYPMARYQLLLSHLDNTTTTNLLKNYPDTCYCL